MTTSCSDADGPPNTFADAFEHIFWRGSIEPASLRRLAPEAGQSPYECDLLFDQDGVKAPVCRAAYPCSAGQGYVVAAQSEASVPSPPTSRAWTMTARTGMVRWWVLWAAADGRDAGSTGADRASVGGW